jgi:hypothetical protein
MWRYLLTKFRGQGGKKSERNRARKLGKTSQELVCKQTAPEVGEDVWALPIRKKTNENKNDAGLVTHGTVAGLVLGRETVCTYDVSSWSGQSFSFFVS